MVDFVAEVDVVDIVLAADPSIELLPQAEPLGLGRSVRSQLDGAQNTPELVPRHGSNVVFVEVFEHRVQLRPRLLHLATQNTAAF